MGIVAMESHQIAVFVMNKLVTSTTCNGQDVPRLFARYVREHLSVREEHKSAKFQSSGHFISFASQHISVMAMGVITPDMFTITMKEVRYSIMD
jgi:hypothetical protein